MSRDLRGWTQEDGLGILGGHLGKRGPLLRNYYIYTATAMARPYLIFLHQTCCEVPHRPCIMYHDETGLLAKPVVAQAGAVGQSTLNAHLELGCATWPVKTAFLWDGSGQSASKNQGLIFWPCSIVNNLQEGLANPSG